MKLLADWRQAWRWWSVRVSALGAALMMLMIAGPDLWSSLPDDLRGQIPADLSQKIALALFVASAAARMLKQREPGDDR